MTISQGLGGPKLSTERCLGDGQPVNIPARPLDNIKMTESSTSSVLLDLRSLRKIFQASRKFSLTGEEIRESTLPRKVLIAYSNGLRTENRHRWAGVSAPR